MLLEAVVVMRSQERVLAGWRLLARGASTTVGVRRQRHASAGPDDPGVAGGGPTGAARPVV